ncbi:rhomboid family intramembrane serine protease [Actinokineospora iranica]|uniref:Membrane associated serine protease, rhomboid family n=1 Tax=Actinokineospora iranica TaxID=1271860 RepID=A0A1G6PGF4_9PSEU|nr:rhomboid family intramembrane serine protease [Actinokineospora iranica]SDC79081.1 Membrane associated serine protease, rhomboid family [Actinokineospora iranica]
MSTPPNQPDPYGTQAGLPACVRHAGRPTGLSCTRCGRPACPECLVEAAVGFQCVDCVTEGSRTVRRPTTAAGAELASKPVLVPVLIAVNVAIFVLTVALAGDPVHNERSAFFHALTAYAPSIADGQLWRVLTSGFLHFGMIHILVNMVALWFLRDIELLLGKVRFGLLYVLSLLGGSAAAYAFGDLGAEGAGASGAIYGLLGGLVVAVIRLKSDRHVLMTVIGVLALNLAISVKIPEISLLAHLGGLFVGAAVTFGMVYAPPERRRRWQVGTVVLVTVAIIGLFVVRTPQVAEVTFCVDPTTPECYRIISR